jgi:hypothetical protein
VRPDHAPCPNLGRLTCGQCKIARYCCKSHQVIDWPNHKRVCKKSCVGFEKNCKRQVLYRDQTKCKCKKSCLCQKCSTRFNNYYEEVCDPMPFDHLSEQDVSSCMECCGMVCMREGCSTSFEDDAGRICLECDGFNPKRW